MSEKGTTLYPVRLTLIVAVFCLWCIAILGRLGYLQVLQHGQFLRSAQERQQLTRSLPAPRGIIYDSGLNLLATSAPVSRVIAEPRKIKNQAETAQALAPILDLDPARLLKRLQDPARRSYLVVKQRIGPQEEAEIDALDLEGVYFEEGSMRAYPNMELACHVLGFVNMEGNGGAGIELQYDRELKGRPGLQSHDVDARRVSFRGKVIQPPVQGHSLVTSLDKTIQFIVERELAEGVRSNRAASGTAIVMEPATGRILALANHPGFNSNLYNEAAPELWRNKAATDFFEPGSTFKVVVAAAALEAGLARPEELIDCQMGSIIIGRHAFRDHKPYGLLTFRQVLENSSNVGAAKLGLRLGEPGLHGFLQQFGFGARTGIDLPGEVVGLVRHPRDWSALSIGAISFGQEIGVTSLQILRAINAVANGGYLVTPTVVDRIIDDKGDLIRLRAAARNRILSPRTAAAVSDAFEGVVLRGTGRRGSVEGYRCAGKTGTAQKIIQGRYSDTKYLSSFIGFAPLPNPRISVLVQIDEPQGKIYGGDVAAPVFAKMTQDILIHLRVPPDQTVPLPAAGPSVAAGTQDYAPNSTPVAPVPSSGDGEGDSGPIQEIIVATGPDSVVLPDFRGKAKREVIERCLELGVQLRVKGSGTASSQDPPAGAVLAVGETCSVEFSRTGISEGPGDGRRGRRGAPARPDPAVRSPRER